MFRLHLLTLVLSPEFYHIPYVSFLFQYFVPCVYKQLDYILVDITNFLLGITARFLASLLSTPAHALHCSGLSSGLEAQL